MVNERKMLYAGSWYPIKEKHIVEYLPEKREKEDIISCVVPHAGWIYSGRTAGKVFSRIKRGDVFIIISPNHNGLGSSSSIMCMGSWETPLGHVKIETPLAEMILQKSEVLIADPVAHSREHAIEVQLPFIKYLFPEAKIVPITMYDYDVEVCKEIASAISLSVTEYTKKENKKVILVASSDMTHYEPQENAEKKDNLALDKILNLDGEGLLKVVSEKHITMCGSGPVATVLFASVSIGAKKAYLVEYTTSGKVSGDYESVVGYAGVIIK
jgi:AmmeMemoRadiSam system protein B